MKILITGASRGIGRATALYFLNKGYEVYGLDMLEASIDDTNYHHYTLNLIDEHLLPEIKGINYIFNNAGLQNTTDDIDNNLKTAINVTEKYAFQEDIKSVLFNASASASTGFEYPKYVASKAGLIGYMKNAAVRLAKYQATCNSISPGGVLTESNKVVIEDKESWKKIMDVTPLKKWASEEEIAEWAYFLLVVNKSATGIDILIDNGENHLNSSFVWPNFE